MDLPERLKGGDDTDDEEVLAPARGQPSFLNMNQSIFGLLAAAGSTVDFNDRFEGHSSDDDADEQDDDNSGAASPRSDKHRNRRSLYDRLDMRLPRLRDNGDTSKTTVLTRESTDKTSRHRRMASGSRKLFASLPRLPKRKSKKEKEAPVKIESPSEEASESSSEVPVSSLSDSKHDRDSSSDNLGSSTNRLAPVMSRMLEAKADVSMRPSFDMERPSGDYSRFSAGESASSPLAVRLAEIFGFAEPEEVIEGRRSVSAALGTILTVHRVPLLAAPERPASRLHVHHTEAHLLLRVPPQESCKPLSPPPAVRRANILPARGHQVRLPCQEWQEEPKVQPLLDASQG
jgi:sterol 3beta-glucosyltransferase